MKKILSIFMSALIIVSAAAFSAEALSGGAFSYEIENGQAVITGYTGAGAAVTVPSQIGGYSVLAIGEGAFKNNTVITSVNITEGIKEIRANAFNSCTRLATVNLPKSLQKFGENAIYNTAYYNNKSNWTVRPKELGSSGGIIIGNGQDTVPYEFIVASELEYIYLGTVLVKAHVVGSYSVKFETTVVADGALKGETGIKTFSVSSKTLVLGSFAFEGCTSLKSINLNDNCKVYEDTFLNTEIYNTESNWNGDFLTVGTRAVASRGEDREITVNDGITYLSTGTVGTKNVYIPASVAKIDIDAFSGNSSVIYGYKGTYAEEFAQKNGFIFVDMNNVLMGDLDFDGDLSPNDYAIYHASITYERKMTKYEMRAGDLTGDGVIDAFDAIYLEVLINDKTATVKGDISGDGIIDEDDYTYLLNVVKMNCKGVGENYTSRTDLNGDGVVDAFDLIYLDLYLHGEVTL